MFDDDDVEDDDDDDDDDDDVQLGTMHIRDEVKMRPLKIDNSLLSSLFAKIV